MVTKAGRSHGDPETRISNSPHGPANYTLDAITEAVEGSRRRLGVDTLDLVQLHCPPLDVIKEGKVFDVLRDLKGKGLLAHWGVSVETVEDALLCIAQPDCASIQIIYNALRLKPGEVFFDAAAKANVGIIARLPLASGMLAKGGSSRLRAHLAALPASDHRVFNVSGAAFDKGESLSGLGEHLEAAVYPAVEELIALVPAGVPMAAYFLRFVLMHPAVTTVIPGMRTPLQVEENISAAALPPLTDSSMSAITSTYDNHIRPLVHGSW